MRAKKKRGRGFQALWWFGLAGLSSLVTFNDSDALRV
jgi:hypothetical protein